MECRARPVIGDGASSVTVARAAAVGALALAVALAVWLLLFRGDGGTEYTLLFQSAGQLVKDDDVQVGGAASGTSTRCSSRTPASSSRTTTSRSAPALGPRHRAHRRQPGGDQGHRRGALRAAARGHPGRHPAHLAVGHRQPLRRAHARARRRQGAARRRDAHHRVDHRRRRPRPDLQHARREDARRPRRRHQGLRHPVRGQGRARPASRPKYFNPLLSTSRRLVAAGHRGRGRAHALPRQLLARGHRDRRAPRRPRRPRRQRERDRRRRSAPRTSRWRARSACCRPRCGAPTRRS